MVNEPNYLRKYISWRQIEIQIAVLAKWMKPRQIDGILAIGRGGLVPGVMLSHKTGLCVDVVMAKRYNTGRMYIAKYNPRWDTTLIIDDIVDQGITMRKVKAMFKGRHTGLTASLFYDYTSSFSPDYIGKAVDPEVWLVFPWEEFH